MDRKVSGGLKLFHDKFAKNIKELDEYAAEFDEAVLHNEQMKNCLHKVACPHYCNVFVYTSSYTASAQWACDVLCASHLMGW